MIQTFAANALPGDSPAAIDKARGIIFLGPKYFELDHFARAFVLAHELGHYALDTASEEAADAFAIEALSGRAPRSHARSVETIAKFLNIDDSLRHQARAAAALKKAQEMDDLYYPPRYRYLYFAKPERGGGEKGDPKAPPSGKKPKRRKINLRGVGAWLAGRVQQPANENPEPADETPAAANTAIIIAAFVAILILAVFFISQKKS